MRFISLLLIPFLLMLLSPAATPPAPTRTLDRELDPLVVSGARMPDFAGVNLARLFVYVYRNSDWSQIPWQFDEVSNGKIVANEDGLLDGDDELVFMAADTGDRAPAGSWINNVNSQQYPRYEITVTDPLDRTKKGWAYVYRSATLHDTVTDDYVNFDAAQLVIAGERYRLGLVRNRMIADRLEMNNSGVDVLDRTKIRVQVPMVGLITEDRLEIPLPTLRRDGRIRAVVVIADDQVEILSFVGYRSLFRYAIDIDLSEIPLPLSLVRLSADLNEAAVGSIYYGANTSAGVTIDGVPDNVPTTPVSDWVQASGSSGTFIQVADWTGTGGTASTYYKDDATIDPADTGDKKSYGDAGIRLDNPSKHLQVAISTYVLPPNQPNVGARYCSYIKQPLETRATAQHYTPPRFVYLPAALKNH